MIAFHLCVVLLPVKTNPGCVGVCVDRHPEGVLVVGL